MRLGSNENYSLFFNKKVLTGEFMLFKFHSLVDVITNSSTTIYTNSDNCIEPAKELVQEFLNTFGIDKKVDDIFTFDSFMDIEEYCDFLIDYDPEEYDNIFKDLGWEERDKKMELIIESIVQNNIKKPDWMNDAENSKIGDYDSGYDSRLYIFTKEDKYKALGDKIKNFLYSTDIDADYN